MAKRNKKEESIVNLLTEDQKNRAVDVVKKLFESDYLPNKNNAYLFFNKEKLVSKEVINNNKKDLFLKLITKIDHNNYSYIIKNSLTKLYNKESLKSESNNVVLNIGKNKKNDNENLNNLVNYKSNGWSYAPSELKNTSLLLDSGVLYGIYSHKKEKNKIVVRNFNGTSDKSINKLLKEKFDEETKKQFF